MSRAASLPGAEVFSQKSIFLSRPLVPGNFAAWGSFLSQNMDVQDFWDSCAQNKTLEISKKRTFRISGTPVRRTKRRTSQKWTFKNSGTPVRRTKRRKYHKMDFQEFWDSCARNKVPEISKNDFQEFWNFCAQNKTSEISHKMYF